MISLSNSHLIRQRRVPLWIRHCHLCIENHLTLIFFFLWIILLSSLSPKPNTGFCAFFFKVYGSKTIYSFNVHVHCVGSPSSNKFSFFVSVNICCLVLLYIYCVVYRFSLCGLEGGEGGELRFGFLLHIPSAYTGLVKDETNEFIFTLNSAEIQPRPLKYC